MAKKKTTVYLDEDLLRATKVAAARAAKVHYLVSGDSHLTGLADPRPPVLTPQGVLERV